MKGRVHGLGYVPSRARHVIDINIGINNVCVESPEISLPDGFVSNYDEDMSFGVICRSLEAGDLRDKINTARIAKLLPFFIIRNGVLYCEENICVPRRNVKHILFLAHL